MRTIAGTKIIISSLYFAVHLYTSGLIFSFYLFPHLILTFDEEGEAWSRVRCVVTRLVLER